MAFGTLIIYHYIIFYQANQHPVVVELSRRPAALLDLALDELYSARRLLIRTHRLENVLAKVGVGVQALDDAIHFDGNFRYDEKYSAARRCKLIENRLNSEIGTDLVKEPKVFTLHLPDNFILNVQTCALTFLNSDKHINEIVATLKTLPAASVPVIFLISNDPNQQQAFRRTENNRTRMWVVPDKGHQSPLHQSS